MNILITFIGGKIERVAGPTGVAITYRTLSLDSPALAVSPNDWLKDAKAWLDEPDPRKDMDLCGWSMFELGTTAGFKRTCATDKSWFRADGRGAAYGKWQAWLEKSRIAVVKHLPEVDDDRRPPDGPDGAFELYFETPQAFIRWAADLP